ncbi:SpaA isopeptide-forming pilin-related protein [Neglectibacter sp. CSJ-5]|uniref:SpaA isopeptide-forming pilin-related protein n=1 Tax=Neglectibacter sp. CSJ-5 TaxID=3078043 RepID=UPI00292E2F56|nr:SpaA isopeptide-forming pilin-related protein [Neglectibacter sp. CSJ-5]
MKTKFTKKGRRILSAALCLLMMITALPMSAFAWTSEEGKSCTSSFGDYYVGSDGEYYRSKATYSFIVYDSKGNITVQSINAGNAKRKYLMTDNSGTHQVYCVESGVDFNTGNSYVSKSGKNSSYFQNLPTDAQFGIMMALMYGWHEGKSSPVAGTNVDDYAFATQTIIWEYQQQLRTSPSNRQSANGIDGDTYYYSLKGRPAEKCYNWILSQMSKHYTIPSFAARSQSNADTYTLKYNPDTKKYSLTLEDTNNTLSDIKFSASGISVTRSGNKYTFTSDKMITSPVTVSAQKNVNLDCGEMLIWGCVGKQTMVSGASDPVYFYLKIDTETYGTGQIKKTSEDGVVSGISFNISGNGVNKTVITGADGTVDVQLMPGVYTVTEQSIDRYEPQSVQRVTIVSGHTATVTFNNTLKRGSLEIIKNSEDNLVEGVKFHLYGTSLSGLPVDEYAVTDENGVARFENVLISGETPYTVEEVDTAIRYVVPESQTAPIEWEKVTSRSFTNILKKFNVTVTKSDAETGTAQGDASLAGAVYGIYKGEELIDTYTTDENGQFTTDYYICDDDWTIREISPSEGYLLDTTIHHIGAEPELYTVERNSTANDVTEQIIKGNIAIIKHTDDGETQIETPETGATFEVYLKAAGSYDAAKETERDILTCDENGFAQTKDMPYGVYVVEQTSGWEGRELMKPFEVFISKDGQTYRYLINNANFESYIKIVKKDAETGATIPYTGAGFQIYDPNGELVTMTFTYPEVTTIDTFYTTADGYLITPQTLEYGTGYSIVEVQAPYGYVLNSEPVYFDVTQDGSAEESGITVIEVVRSNMAQKGTITVSKSGEVFTSVSENNGMYQPVFAVQGLEGAVYEITAAEDIYTLDGTLRASKGEVVDTITTGTDGTAKSKELYLGKYEVKEITAPYGMVLNDEIHAVELVYAGQNIAVTETETSFYNERQRVEIDLVKSLETDEAYGVGNNGEIFDVTFGLYAETDLTAADGTVIPADGLIEIISLDENGKGTVNSDLPFGSYYVKELSTNSAYVLNEQKYPVHFEYAGQDTAVVHLSANDGEAIENEIIYGSVSGLKSDEDGKALGGAVIGIFKTGTEEFTKENAIQTTTSADDGSFSFEKVPYGTWVIREIESPTGFVLSEEEIAVTVGKVDEVVEIELVNYFIKGNIELTKVDADYPDNKLTGAVFEVYADTNGNGEFDKDDKLCGEMTELEGGVYQMTELRYGKYFVREKTAPDGFVLDDGVYGVSIEENGKTYTVENKAGVGFINDAQKGSLKIVKTSSDGKVEGFSFRVTSADGYDQNFKTDKNGEIFIEGLRIGEYTVSEVSDSASAGYILPADKQATVKTDSTTIVEMHNEFRDTPKTGDDFNLGLWVSLAAASVIGAGVLGFVGFKKKKKED